MFKSIKTVLCFKYVLCHKYSNIYESFINDLELLEQFI